MQHDKDTNVMPLVFGNKKGRSFKGVGFVVTRSKYFSLMRSKRTFSNKNEEKEFKLRDVMQKSKRSKKLFPYSKFKGLRYQVHHVGLGV